MRCWPCFSASCPLHNRLTTAEFLVRLCSYVAAGAILTLFVLALDRDRVASGIHELFLRPFSVTHPAIALALCLRALAFCIVLYLPMCMGAARAHSRGSMLTLDVVMVANMLVSVLLVACLATESVGYAVGAAAVSMQYAATLLMMWLEEDKPKSS